MVHPLDLFKFCPKCGSNEFEIDSVSSKKCGNCGFEYYKPSVTAVVGLIFDEQGRVLVVRRKKEPAKGSLDLPGGFVDLGETIEETVIREIKEETNIDIEEPKYLFCVPNNYIYSGFDVQTLDFVLKCKIKDIRHIKAEEGEVSEIRFISRDELNPAEFGLKSIKEIIKIIINNKNI